jgi:hypothetical protein
VKRKLVILALIFTKNKESPHLMELIDVVIEKYLCIYNMLSAML